LYFCGFYGFNDRLLKMTTFSVKTSGTVATMDITESVIQAVADNGIQDGAALIYCPHTTAGIFINEGADPDVVIDVEAFMKELVPRNRPYRHAEGNSPAHISSILTGNSAMVPISGGKLMLGRWQHVFLAEFDGPRDRQVYVQLLRS